MANINIKEALKQVTLALKNYADGLNTAMDSRVDTLEGQVSALIAGTYNDSEVRGLIKTNADAIAELEKIDHEAYIGADSALKSELEGKIGTKAEQTALKDVDDRVKDLEDHKDDYKAYADQAEADALASAKAYVLEQNVYLNEELLNKINKKVDQTAYDTKVGELQTAIDGKVAIEEGKSLVLDTEIAKIHSHTNKAELDKVVDGDVAKWNQAVTDVATKASQSDLNALSEEVAKKAVKTEVETALSGKVDKVEGMGLSSNDFTSAEKEKLAGLSNYNDSALAGRVTTAEGEIDALQEFQAGHSHADIEKDIDDLQAFQAGHSHSALAVKSEVETALGLKADKTDLNGLATESYVDGKVSALVDSAPETLDTLNELAQALGDDPNFATTISTEIGKKVDKEEGKSLIADSEIARLATLANYDDTQVRADFASADAQVLKDAKAYADAEDAKIESRVDALETFKNGHSHADIEQDIADNASAIENIAKDYLKASDKTELQGKIDAIVIPSKVSAFENDANYVTSTVLEGKGYAVESSVASRLANKADTTTVNGIESRVVELEKVDHSHGNATVLDGITSAKVSAWDNAEKNAKDYADGLDGAMDERVQALETFKNGHSHESLATKNEVSTKAEKTYVDTELGKKADSSAVYTKEEVNTSINTTMEEISRVESALGESIGKKADASAVYTKTEADAKFLTAHQDISGKVDVSVYNAKVKAIEDSLATKATAQSVTDLTARVAQNESDIDALQAEIANISEANILAMLQEVGVVAQQ